MEQKKVAKTVQEKEAEKSSKKRKHEKEEEKASKTRSNRNNALENEATTRMQKKEATRRAKNKGAK